MPPCGGCSLTVADKALLHNAQFVIIRPRPTAFTISSRQNFDLRAGDKVGHKVGLTIGANTSSDGRPRRLTIWQAETRKDAHVAFDLFIETFEAKYPKSTECLIKDREELLTFYDFPAQQWQSIRTSNPLGV